MEISPLISDVSFLAFTPEGIKRVNTVLGFVAGVVAVLAFVLRRALAERPDGRYRHHVIALTFVAEFKRCGKQATTTCHVTSLQPMVRISEIPAT